MGCFLSFYIRPIHEVIEMTIENFVFVNSVVCICVNSSHWNVENLKAKRKITRGFLRWIVFIRKSLLTTMQRNASCNFGNEVPSEKTVYHWYAEFCPDPVFVSDVCLRIADNCCRLGNHRWCTIRLRKIGMWLTYNMRCLMAYRR